MSTWNLLLYSIHQLSQPPVAPHAATQLWAPLQPAPLPGAQPEPQHYTWSSSAGLSNLSSSISPLSDGLSSWSFVTSCPCIFHCWIVNKSADTQPLPRCPLLGPASCPTPQSVTVLFQPQFLMSPVYLSHAWVRVSLSTALLPSSLFFTYQTLLRKWHKLYFVHTQPS